MPRRRKRKSNNPVGRPVTVGGEQAVVPMSLSMPVALVERTDAAAELAGLTRSQWWRLAAMAALGRSVSFGGAVDPSLVE